LYYLVNSPSWL